MDTGGSFCHMSEPTGAHLLPSFLRKPKSIKPIALLAMFLCLAYFSTLKIETPEHQFDFQRNTLSHI
jgi:hypothetical protein